MHNNHPLSGMAQPPSTFLSKKGGAKELETKRTLFQAQNEVLPCRNYSRQALLYRKNQYVNTASAAASGNLRRKIANIRIRCCFFEKVS